ncbi:RusA family crossover junction endodeoxyribonuclease [Enterococcus italicus]|uniref:RusA family crossover junction endodeoxyribonuclease n=1 Tax=Enterococcus italicus TaxID=246144 RepID=UPI0028AD71D9|nr:RusA family crossover junction endodeoxyribonuclease [Enterococcus italicus]
MKLIIPVPPKPQSRPRFDGRNKRAYEKNDMKRYKQSISYYARASKIKPIEKGPIMAEICFCIYPPQYLLRVKKNRNLLEKELVYCDKKPDLDNYFKAVTDTINGILYKDDGQISAIICRKVYSLNPRTEIQITKLGD